ncbi:hypothetical protein CTA2_331 [Colletotrichum tanaceti]|uniref:Uncharacterized protein n=1 Tax=Colletotrichum tanaceti TaxID=1306861 RepID=A0A4U6X779_9PEZI|nr:hypothetical protein CTA2_331 [Colletotrichum tanaceti]TKW51342.1 hypothetical protein CTA1_10691 [Colletotrichum tanaceti]
MAISDLVDNSGKPAYGEIPPASRLVSSRLALLENKTKKRQEA